MKKILSLIIVLFGFLCQAQTFVWETSTSRKTCCLYKQSSPTSTVGNRWETIYVNKDTIAFRHAYIYFDSLLTKNDGAPAITSKLMWIDGTTGKAKVSRKDSIHLAYTQITSRPAPITYYNLSGTVTAVTKKLNAIVTPTALVNSYTIGISTASFSSISRINITAARNTTVDLSVPVAAIKTYNTSNVIVNVIQTSTATTVMDADTAGLKLHLSIEGN